MKQQVEIEVDVPEGWEVTGEFRLPRYGEHFLSAGIACRAAFNFQEAMSIILRKVEPKRETRYTICPRIVSTYDTYERAAADFPGYRIERIDYENGHPVAVSLEPLSEEGA